MVHFKGLLIILVFLLFLNGEIRPAKQLQLWLTLPKGGEPSFAKNYGELGLS